MIRLLSIEYFKLKNSRYFWVLSFFFLLFLIAVPIGSKVFLNYLSSIGEDFLKTFDVGELPLFDFVDIWQNLTWVYSSFSIFLGFVLVISVCNEFSYGTVKQNVIDGLSRTEFLLSKFVFILVNSFVVSLVVFIIGLVMGLLWSPVKEIGYILENVEFIGAYFLHLIGFQTFCMVIALLIKRSGIAIALLIFYIFIIEFFATKIIEYHFKLPWLADLFPINAIGNIIPLPFTKYLLKETQNYVSLGDLVTLLAYIGILLFISYRLVVKRDLR